MEAALTGSSTTGAVETELNHAAGASFTPARAWAMWAVAVSAYVAAVFHRNGLAVAFIEAQRRLGIGASALASLVALQVAIYAAMQIPTGALTDRLGPRKMLGAAMAAMATGEMLFALAHGVVEALVGRGLVGLGDSMTFLSVLRVVQSWFPARRYGLLASLTSMMGALGQLVSTFPLHLALVRLGWSFTFGATALATAALGVVLVSVVRDRPPSIRSLGETPPREKLVLAVRAVMGVRSTWTGLWVHFTLTGPFVLFSALWGFPYLVKSQHLSQGTASDALAGAVVVAALCAAPVGLLIIRAPRQRVPLVVANALGLAATWVTVLAMGHAPVPLLVLLVVMTGAAAPVSVCAFDIAREANPTNRGGAATGVVNIGGFAGAVVVDLLIGWLIQEGAGYRWSMASIPVMIAIGLVALAISVRPEPLPR